MSFIEMNGKEYKLRYNINSISDLEEKMNKGLFSMIQEENIGIGTCRALLWAGIKHINKYLTFEDVGEMMNIHLKNGGEFKDMIEKVMLGLKDSGLLGKVDEEETEEETEELTDNEKKENLKKVT